MSTGSVVRVSLLATSLLATSLTDATQDSISRDITSPEESIREQMLEHRFGLRLLYRTHDLYFAETEQLITMRQRYESSTMLAACDVIETGVSKTVSNIWDTNRLKALLSQPVGSPIDLTIEEAEEVVRLAAGRRSDLPPGKDFVKEVRELLGHSLIERLKKNE